MEDFIQNYSDPRMLFCTATTVQGAHPAPWFFISERLCRDFLTRRDERRAGPAGPKFSEDAVNPNLTKPQQDKLWSVIRDFDHIFQEKAGIFKHTVVSLRLKPDAKPVAVTCPRWTPAVGEYLTGWATDVLAAGTWSYASSQCAWASRSCPVGKFEDQAKEIIRDIRNVYDYRVPNDNLHLPVPGLPNPDHYREKFAGWHYLSSIDMSDGFSHLRLNPDDDSRDVLAVWTPLGLLVPNFMPQGVHRAPGDFQRAMEKSFQHLTFWNKSAAAYLDDVTAGADDFDSHVQQLRDIFQAMEASGLHGSARKLRLGYRELTILGKRCSKKGIAADTGKIDAILKMSDPSNVSEVRSILGMTNFIQAHIPDYSRLVAPLTNLLKSAHARPSGQPYLNRAERKCMKKLRRALTTLPVLTKYESSQRLYLRTDASQVGIGGALHAGSDRNAPVIQYFSLKFSDTQTRWATYVREAYGVIYGVQQCRYYIDASDHELTIVTDHRPLLWLWHARSPMVVGWVLEHLQTIRFKVEYLPGKQNLLPDGLSRVPCIAPGSPTLIGEAEATLQLLHTIPPPRAGSTLWLAVEGTHAALETRLKSFSCRLIRAGPTMRSIQAPWDLAIIIPAAERSPAIARDMFALRKPFALLMPQDLVHCIADDTLPQDIVEKCRKILFIDDNLVWLVYGLGMEQHYIYPLVATSLAPRVTRQQIIDAQRQDPFTAPLWTDNAASVSAGPSEITLRQGIAVTVDADNTSAKIFVPEQLRRPLINYAHLMQNHSKAPTLVPFIKERFIWFRPDGKDIMHSDVLAILRDCHFCQLAHARIVLNHGRYSSLKWSSQGQGIGIDHMHVGIPGVQCQYILTIIDLFSGFLQFIPCISTTAEETVEIILNRWSYIFGFPEAIFSDYHSSFVGTLAKRFCDVAGLDWLTTAPYSHHQLGFVECRHKAVRTAIQSLSKADKTNWPSIIPSLSFAQNTYVSTSTGATAFEGMLARKPRCTLDFFESSEIVSARASASSAALDAAPTPSLQTLDQIKLLTGARTAVTAYISEYSNISRARSVAQKNKGRRKATKEWKVGDTVSAYRPKPSKQGIPASSVLHFDGPYTIVEQVNSNCFKLRHLKTNKILKRIDRSHLSPYTAPVDGTAPLNTVAMENYDDDSVDYKVGEIIAIVDQDRIKLGIILDRDPERDEDDFVIHQLGTTSDTNPVYRPVYEDEERRTRIDWRKPPSSWKPLTIDGENDQVVHRHITWKPSKNKKDRGKPTAQILKRLRGPLITGETFPLHTFVFGQNPATD